MIDVGLSTFQTHDPEAWKCFRKVQKQHVFDKVSIDGQVVFPERMM